MSRNMETFTSWNPLGPSGHVTGLIYLYRYLLSLRSPGSYLCLRRLLVTSILLSFFHKVLTTIKIQHKIPKIKTNYKVQYLRLNTLTVSVLYCWVISVLFYTQNMKEILKIFWHQ